VQHFISGQNGNIVLRVAITTKLAAPPARAVSRCSLCYRLITRRQTLDNTAIHLHFLREE
jgi:hypothetical protein